MLQLLHDLRLKRKLPAQFLQHCSISFLLIAKCAICPRDHTSDICPLPKHLYKRFRPHTANLLVKRAEDRHIDPCMFKQFAFFTICGKYFLMFRSRRYLKSKNNCCESLCFFLQKRLQQVLMSAVESVKFADGKRRLLSDQKIGSSLK